MLNRDEVFSIAIQLDCLDLLSFCQVNKYINKCLGEIWIYKLKQDFPGFKIFNKSFKNTYKLLYSLSKLKNIFNLHENIYDIYERKKLYLSDFNLEIPKEISVLINLRELDLSSNDLEIFPKEIYHLTNLEELDLGNNLLTEISEGISRLLKLKVLNLSENQLTEVSKELGEIKNLEKLYLTNNFLSNLPKELGHLKNLQEIGLSRNLLKEIPYELINLPQLHSIYLNQNPQLRIPVEFLQKEELIIYHYV